MNGSPREERPLLLFDGDCGFCRRAVLRLQRSVGDRVACVPYQEHDFETTPPAVTPEACADAVHLVEPGGRVSRAAEACFRALAHAPARGWLRAAYRLPGVAAVTEAGYRQVAAHRPPLSKVVRLLSGSKPEPPTFGFGRRAFVALLGIALLAAFVSFGVQAAGLIGSGGILPLERMVAWDEHALPAVLLDMPTVFWFTHGVVAADLALFGVIVAGALAALAVAAGLWPRAGLAVAGLCWLSLSALAFPPQGPYIGNVFLGYQWDGLLVEAALLGLFVAPRGIRPRWRDAAGTAGLLLLRLLLLRIVLGEALVAVTAGDGSWAEPGAVARHLWTWPLPTWIGLHAQDLAPALLAAAGTVGDVVGLVLVFGLFGPRRVRVLAAVAIAVVAGAQFLVLPRGPWHLVVVALACVAVDDAAWRAVLPRRVALRIGAVDGRLRPAWSQAVRGALAVVLATLALYVTVRFLGDAAPSPLHETLLRTQIVNGYGAAPSVRDARYAVTLEGSDDGETWSVLVPRAAPSDPYRPPTGPGFHLRRMDWKLAEVARVLAEDGPEPDWFVRLLVRLLEGSPEVRGLFAPGAFDDAPPRALRLGVHGLRPAPAGERSGDGMWWHKVWVRTFPPWAVEDGRLVPARF